MSDGDVEHYATFLAARTRRQDPTDQDRALVDTLLAELKLDGRLLPPGGVGRVEYGLQDTKMTRRNYPMFIGSSEWARTHATHRRVVIVWADPPRPNDCWGKYTSNWVEM